MSPLFVNNAAWKEHDQKRDVFGTLMRFWLTLQLLVQLSVAVTASFMFCSTASAASPETPKCRGFVTDLASVLTKHQRAQLASRLAAYRRETGHEIAVLSIPSLEGETLESFSLRASRGCRLGQAQFNDGILVVLALKEQSVRIELGTGMEKFISSDDARLIVQGAMLPDFRKRDFRSGLTKGLNQLMEAARKYVTSRRHP